MPGLLLSLLLLGSHVQAAETTRYSGTVVDAAGNPVAGAIVEFYQSGPSWPSDSAAMKPQKTLTTGADGAFEFQGPPSTTILFARKPGLGPDWNTYWNRAKDVTEERLVLTPPTTLAGIVVDDADKPVADAQVWITAAYSERPAENGTALRFLNTMPARELFSVRTGADGKFRIEGCPTNASVDLAVSKPGKVLRELQREYRGPDTMRCHTGQQDVKLVLDAAGTIEGKIRSQETGQPLAGVRVSLQSAGPGNSPPGPGPEPVKSDADGKFRLTEVAPGTYRVHAAFGTNALPDWVAEPVPVSVEAGRTTRDVELSATKGGFLQVAVLGKADRKPLPQAGVSVSKAPFFTGAFSDTNGLALLRLPPGEYQVAAHQDNSRSEETPASVEAGKTNRIEIELNPPPKLTGIVRDATGAPMPGLAVTLFGGFNHPNAGETKTDADGRFELKWNPNTRNQNQPFCLVARDVARNLAIAHEIDEETEPLDLRLEPGLVIAGRVEDPQGKPLTQATAQVQIWVGNSTAQLEEKPNKADAQGRFQIAGLPADYRFYLWVNAKGYGSSYKSIEHDSETNRVELEPFVLRVADRKLAGQVVDAEDKPVARAWVSMSGDGQPSISARTDEKGRFRFDQVCEGQIRLFANVRSSYGNAQAEGGDTNVVIKLGVSQSYGSVRQAPSRPSLKDKPLPDLAQVGFPGDCAPAGKPVLLCLFDSEQRPSRRVVRLLAEQYDALRQKGLTVLGLQATITTPESLKEWKDANPVPFPIGRVAEKSDKTRWASNVESLPWLILTDADHRVTAEGFSLDELESKLTAAPK